jgi:hypothetical protein
MKKLFVSIALMLSLTVSAGAIVPVHAASLPTTMTQFAACDPGSFFGFPTWYACLPKDSTGHPKLTKLEDVWLVGFSLIEAAVKAAAYVAVGLTIWGSILFIKSQGNPGLITSARDTIRDAVIGLIICVSAVAIIQFMASRL